MFLSICLWDFSMSLCTVVVALVNQPCLILCDSTDCSLPASSVHGILQARILQWVAIAFSRVSSQPRDWTHVSCIAGGFFTIRATREAPLKTQLIPGFDWPQTFWDLSPLWPYGGCCFSIAPSTLLNPCCEIFLEQVVGWEQWLSLGVRNRRPRSQWRSCAE